MRIKKNMKILAVLASNQYSLMPLNLEEREKLVLAACNGDFI